MREALRQQLRTPIRDRREVEQQPLPLDDHSLEGREHGESGTFAVEIERWAQSSTPLQTERLHSPGPLCEDVRKSVPPQACSNMHQMRV